MQRADHVQEALTAVAIAADGLTVVHHVRGRTRRGSSRIRPEISDEAYAAGYLTVLGRLAGSKGTVGDAARTFAHAARSGAADAS